MRTHLLLFVALAASPVGAQSLAERVRASDGDVQVVFPSRPGTCGDGRGMIANLVDTRVYFQGPFRLVNTGGEWRDRLCVRGPARVVASVVEHHVVSLRTYVGPVFSSEGRDVRTIDASANEAAAWLSDIFLHDSARIASQALLPLMLADSSMPWPTTVGLR